MNISSCPAEWRMFRLSLFAVFVSLPLIGGDRLIEMPFPSTEAPGKSDDLEGYEQDFARLVQATPIALGVETVRSCLGDKLAPDNQRASLWNSWLIGELSVPPELGVNAYITLPRDVSSFDNPVLWIPMSGLYCLLDRTGQGWKFVARHEDPDGPLFMALDDPEQSIPRPPATETRWSETNLNFVWELTDAGWRVVRYWNGGSLGGWWAESLEVSRNGRTLTRHGPRVGDGGNSVFELLRFHRTEDNRLEFSVDTETLGRARGCWLASPAGGVERSDHQRTIITEELRLGRRLSDMEAEVQSRRFQLRHRLFETRPTGEESADHRPWEAGREAVHAAAPESVTRIPPRPSLHAPYPYPSYRTPRTAHCAPKSP